MTEGGLNRPQSGDRARQLSCTELAYSRPTSGFFFQAEDGIRDGTVTGVQDVCSSDLILDVRRRAGGTEDAFRVRLVLGEQQRLWRTGRCAVVAVQIAPPVLRIVERDGVGARPRE